MRRLLAALAAVLFFVGHAFAQNGSATLTGFVQDSSKAFVPGARVTVTKTNTNTPFVATTGKDGSYTVSSLPVGPYRIEIEKPGFKTILKDDLFLHTQDTLQINFELAVGSTAESITVTGGTTNESPAVSMTVSREFVESMPLNGRSFQDLIQLAPGAVSSQGYFSINGQRTDANNYIVDGVSANLGGLTNSASKDGGIGGNAPSQTALGTTQSLVSIDSLQEFTIQTSGYSAEYGRSPGGQVEFTTRSGTNQTHGSLFEYLRNTAFDANSYTNNFHGTPQTAEHQNDFGGTLGGPITIPRLYSGTDRTFYFLSYEGLRLLLPAYESEYVPTMAFRRWAAPSFQPVLNAKPLPSAGSVGNQDGCVITDPASGQPSACDALFNYGYSYPSKLDSFSIRGDHTFRPKLHAFVRYADTPSSLTNGAEALTRTTIDSHLWTVGLTTSLPGGILNDFRFNFTRDDENVFRGQQPIGGSIPLARSEIIPAQYDNDNAQGNYVVSVPGSSLSANILLTRYGTLLRQYQLTDNIARTIAGHTLKLGIDWRRLNSLATNTPYQSTIASQSLSDIKNSYATIVVVKAAASGQPIFNNVSVYAQDHWNVRRSFTLDYGLRWEFNPPPGPSNGHYPVTLTSSNLAIAQLAPIGTEPYRTTYTNFAPRIGFVWKILSVRDRITAVRAGFGIFYGTAQDVVGGAYNNAYPFTASGPTQSHILLPAAPATFAPPALPSSLTPPYPNLQGMSSPDLSLPYTEQWNLSIDQQLAAKNTLTISYVGNNGRKLLFTQAYLTAPQGNKAFSSGMGYTYNGSQSSYNALQIQDSGRIAPGLDGIVSFSLTHALDNSSGAVGAAYYTPVYGNSDYDIRRALNVALNYHPPIVGSNNWGHALTQGWLISNRFSAQSGLPLNVIQSNVIQTDGSYVVYTPDLKPGVPIYLHGNATMVNGMQSPGSWRLNPSAFQCVPTNGTAPCIGTPTRLGTLGRNYVRNPPFWALNTAIQRTFPIKERLQLDFRAEAFNIFNHPNLSNPNTTLSNSTFGQLIFGSITTIGTNNVLYAMGANRSLQLSLRLHF